MIILSGVIGFIGQLVLCLALLRIFRRTGHGGIWAALAFTPVVLFVVYRLGFAFFMGDTVLIVMVSAFAGLILPVLLAVFALKSWPVEMVEDAPEVFE